MPAKRKPKSNIKRCPSCHEELAIFGPSGAECVCGWSSDPGGDEQAMKELRDIVSGLEASEPAEAVADEQEPLPAQVVDGKLIVALPILPEPEPTKGGKSICIVKLPSYRTPTTATIDNRVVELHCQAFVKI